MSREPRIYKRQSGVALVVFGCLICGSELQSAKTDVGKVYPCPKCGTPTTVPEPHYHILRKTPKRQFTWGWATVAVAALGIVLVVWLTVWTFSLDVSPSVYQTGGGAQAQGAGTVSTARGLYDWCQRRFASTDMGSVSPQQESRIVFRAAADQFGISVEQAERLYYEGQSDWLRSLK